MRVRTRATAHKATDRVLTISIVRLNECIHGLRSCAWGHAQRRTKPLIVSPRSASLGLTNAFMALGMRVGTRAMAHKATDRVLTISIDQCPMTTHVWALECRRRFCNSQ